jgi:hypothetical protein
MSAIAGAHGGPACAKAITVNIRDTRSIAQPLELTTLWTIPQPQQIQLLMCARRCFSGSYIFFELFWRLRGFIGFNLGYGCRWGLWGTALHRPGDAMAGFFRAGQRRGRCTGRGVGLRSQVGGGIGVAEADMLVVRASLTDCRIIVSEGGPQSLGALPCILPGCSPEHRILRRRQVKQLQTIRIQISVAVFPLPIPEKSAPLTYAALTRRRLV